MEPRDRRLTSHDSWTHPLGPRRTREAEVDPPSQHVDAREAILDADMDDTETVALIRDGHTFGKMLGACRKRAADQPLTLSQELEERPATEYGDVIQEVARNETQQVQKQVTKPELQCVERIHEMRP